MDVRIGGALAVVIIVEALLRVVEGADGVQGPRVIAGDDLGQADVLRGGERVLAPGHAGLEEVGGMTAHFVEVGLHVRFPVVPLFDPGPRLRML